MQPEYRNLVEDFLDLVRLRFADDLVSVALYGSVAAGRARPDSDVDVCVVARNLPPSLRQRTQLMAPLKRALRDRASYRSLAARGYFPEVMPMLLSPAEARETRPVFLDMVEDGEILVDDGSFAAKLAEIRARMATLGSKRVTLADGTRYWVLKPDLTPGETVTL